MVDAPEKILYPLFSLTFLKFYSVVFQMLDILICGRHELAYYIAQYEPDYLISLLDPTSDALTLEQRLADDRHLTLRFFDVEEAWFYGRRVPDRQDCEEILAFSQNKTGTLLINCEAGISRSSATALAIFAQHHAKDAFTYNVHWGYCSLSRFALHLFQDRKTQVGHGIDPNLRMVQFYDDLLNLNGALLKKAQWIGALNSPTS